LPNDILDGEISYVKGLGVDIKTDSRVKDVDSLFDGGYEAIFMATGAGESPALGIPGEDAEGVIHALDFLKKVNSGEMIALGNKVAVIGGGNAAIDAARVAQRLGVALIDGEEAVVDSARVARRLGVEEVSIIYRRSQEEMPAIKSEVEEAEHEGVKLHLQATPVKILTDNGRVTGLQCIQMELGEPDEDGRRRPIPVEGSEFNMDIDTVIIAIGQTVDKSTLPEKIEYTDWGSLSIDPVSRQTSISGVFAGGDIAAGPANVISVIADGKEVAISIDRYLRGKDLKKGRQEPPERIPLSAEETFDRDVAPRIALERRNDFSEVELGFDENTAIEEGKRCWKCGVSPMHEGVDRNRNCILCTECVKSCPNDNVTLRLRKWGHDLWNRTKGRLDEATGALIIAGLVTVVPIFLILFMSPLKSLLSPSEAAASDTARIASIGILYLSGIAVTIFVMYIFSYLSRRLSGVKDIKTKDFLIHFGYAAIPIGIMTFLADILDHILRTWGAVPAVLGGLLKDFPLNRVSPTEITVRQLLSASQTYVLQLALVGIGLGFSLYVAHKLAGRMFSNKETAFRAFLPIGAFMIVISLAAMWSLSAAL
jgi:NADPH-dependent glutamate synthase beta subunit-like oxidoreductase